MRRRLGLSLLRRANSSTAGTRIAVELVLLRNADIPDDSPMIEAIAPGSLRAPIRYSAPPSHSMIPVFTSAPERTNMAHNTRMNSLANPATASSGVKIPDRTSAQINISATRSTDNHSAVMTTLTATSNRKTNAISKVMAVEWWWADSARAPELARQNNGRQATPGYRET